MKTIKLFLLTVLFSCMSQMALAQSTFLGNLRPAGVAYLGWNGLGPNPGDLQIRNNFAGQRINIFTNNVRRITIMDGGATAADGFVGFANGIFTPVQRVDVNGDINLRTNIFTRNANNDGYRINNQTVLQVKNSGNLFVGWGAGASWTNALAGISENTFVGNNSGFSNNGGFHNAFFGFNSGRNNVIGNNNTFLGFVAGFNNTSSDNTFVGINKV